MVNLITKNKRIVRDGIMNCEINSFLEAQLAELGYAGVEITHTTFKSSIIIRSARPSMLLGADLIQRRIVIGMLTQRFGFPAGTLDVYAEKIHDRGLSAVIQADYIRMKLLSGLNMRRASNVALKSCIEAGAKGICITISGRQRGMRAKTSKLTEGKMLASGNYAGMCKDTAIRWLVNKSGVIGIKVTIMLPPGSVNKKGQTIGVCPDHIVVHKAEQKTLQEVAV